MIIANRRACTIGTGYDEGYEYTPGPERVSVVPMVLLLYYLCKSIRVTQTGLIDPGPSL